MKRLGSFFRSRTFPAVSLWVLVGALFFPAVAQLPTGVVAVPFYDTTRAGLSFRKDNIAVTGMWEVPGKPKHFLVLGYFGFLYTLYPDTNSAGVVQDTTVASQTAPVTKYRRTQVADFNAWVMKGLDFGASGGAFDPNFKTNHYFYVIYNKYADSSQYRSGTPGANNTLTDGPDNPGAVVVVDRYIVAPDIKSLTRDTEIIRIVHGSGYGSSNMVFGADGMLYILSHSYSQSSWDSTSLSRKVLRIDVSKQDPGKMYAIPTDNPWYNAVNPLVRKEVYAFGFRNSHTITHNMLTGGIWTGETGQSRWSEINEIKPGLNYGWNNGGDASTFGPNSLGIEGPCHVGNTLDATALGGAYTASSPTSGAGASFMNPYARAWNGATYNCTNLANPTFYFTSDGNAQDGLMPSAVTGGVAGLRWGAPSVSPPFRGNPSSPFFGYQFASDVWHGNFIAFKSCASTLQNVGGITGITFTGARDHNGLTAWSQDAYGNLYAILTSSAANGPYQYHDILKLAHDQMTPLSVPRSGPTPIPGPYLAKTAAASACSSTAVSGASPVHPGNLPTRLLPGTLLRLPEGYAGVRLYDTQGRRVWSHRGGDASVRIPAALGTGILLAQFER